MTHLSKISTLIFALSLLASGCAAPTAPTGSASLGPAGGKADEDRPLAFGAVEMIDHEFADGERESFGLIVEASDAYYDIVSNGDRLTASVYAADGASNPDYRVTGTLTFHADGVGAFMTDTPIDSSTLLPWQALAVQLTGTLASGDAIDETWIFADGASSAEPFAQAAPTGVFGGLSLLTVVAPPGFGDPEAQTVSLIAELGDAHYGDATDGQLMSAELWADDVESYALETLLTYYIDGIGAFQSENIDVSDLLPYHALNVRLTGELSSGEIVSEQWVFVGGETEARFVGRTQVSAGPLTAMRVQDYTSEEGESEYISFIAELDGEAALFAANGDTLRLEVWAADGASNPDYRVEGELVYFEDGLGAFATEGFIETSSLLPWRAMRVRATGELSGGISIDQTFEFDGVSFEGRPITE